MSHPARSEAPSEITLTLTHPNQKYVRSRVEAAAIVAEAIGAPFSPETLRKAEIPYELINSRVRYADQDLVALAASILSAARKCGRTPAPRRLDEAQAESQSPTS